MNEQKLKRFNKIYPWYGGFSGDLLFWIAIDTLFLQVVKGLTLPEIVATTTIAQILGILLQVPTLKVVEKIGNTYAVRVGAFLALLAALTLTFGNSFAMIVLGRILHELSTSFKTMASITLKNNLVLQGKGNEYIAYSTRSNTVYAVTTMLIALVAGVMFNLHRYLPMLCCIAFCLLCCVLSFFMVDYAGKTSTVRTAKPRKRASVFRLPRFILWSVLAFAIFFSIVITGQENSKLFIQDELLKEFTVDTTSLLISLILLLSRVVRVLANFTFAKLYHKMGDRVGLLLSLLLISSFVFSLLGYAAPGWPFLRYGLMAVGYMVILFIRDPYKLYINNLILNGSRQEDQPKIIMTLELSRKILAALISVAFTAILQSEPMAFVILLYAVLAFCQFLIGLYLYRMIKRANQYV